MLEQLGIRILRQPPMVNKSREGVDYRDKVPELFQNSRALNGKVDNGTEKCRRNSS